MVVGGKEGFGPNFGIVVDVFHHCPGDRQAIVSTGSPAYFIQNQQASAAALGEDDGGFDHFDHEGALPGVNLVLGSDASENTIHDPNVSPVGGHEAANLGQKDAQSNLTQVG